MSAVIRPQLLPTFSGGLVFSAMTVEDVGDILGIENDVYPHPWSRGNFLDSLKSGYTCQVLRETQGELLGYFLLMMGVDEAHLLNISVRGDLQGRGFGRFMLGKIVQLADDNVISSVLLEVRTSNHRALAVYEKYGFVRIGYRKHYYPASAGQREDAIVMRLSL